MQIDINGKRNITLDFNAPKKFRLVKDGAEIPYIRTGKNSFRLSKPVEGFVELEEIVEQPRYMQPVQLRPQQMTVINPQDVDRLNEAVRQMSLVNPQDVIIINQTAEQLEKNQNFIAQTQKEITDNQVYIDQQQQRLNETALGIQALETDNSQRLDDAENAILNLAGDIANTQNMAVEGMNTALNKTEEQRILLQAEIDKKADKDELETLRKDFEEKSDQFSNAMSNYSGGYAYDTLPRDGEAGQILAKRTDRQGDYIWIDQTPVIVKSKTIPTASEKYKGEVYQYVGETGDYTHGYIYECQEIENNFVWVRLDVQPNTAVWGQITGTLSDQTDLQEAFDDKQDKLTQTQMDAVNSGANQSNIAQISTNQTNINTINSKIPAQASSSNQLADKSYVDTADNGLQSQIDAIVASSDVYDIVGTYAELQSYDISTVPVNDIIKVLVDSTHNDAATYYRCVENSNVKSWSYICSEGAYYTKAETNTLLNAKQDTLVSGTNIKTINSNSILGSGNLDIDALPSQTGQSGKFLTTNGTDASWENVDALPSQTGQSGKYLTTDGSSASWAEINTSRNIGEIIQSTIPLSDAGLHLLDGSLISGAGSYAKFVTYISGLVSNYPDLFETEANWQTSVTNYGVCGKFVYDSINNTVRLPKITGFTEGTIDPTTLGDLTQAGLPNITGSWAGVYNSQGLSGAVSGTFKNDGSHPKPAFVNNSATESALFDFDASRSSPIYGNSSTVQPQSIKVLYYIVIATSAKTQIEIDIDEIATDLNGKADVDLSNVNSTGTSVASGWSMPSSRYINLTLGARGSNYTAPANGYFWIYAKTSGTNYQIRLASNNLAASTRLSSLYGDIYLPVKKGDIVSCNYDGTLTVGSFRFIYAEGENV